MLTPDEKAALDMALFLRERGYNPIPSDPDRKKPRYEFAEKYGWDQRFPDAWFTEERWDTSNLQCLTGRHWRLLVIDLDGQAAIEKFATMGTVPRTWVTHSGGGGRHLWFKLPANYPEPLPKVFLLQIDETRPKKHGEPCIERLCDRSLVMCPPSIHPETGRRYQFLDIQHSPRGYGLGHPARCPRWVLNLKPIRTTPIVRHDAPAVTRRHIPVDAEHLDRNVVLEGIHDKVGTARQYGLRVAGRPSPTGWVPCHAIGREDRHPSAAMHQETGVYTDRGSGVTLPFLDTIAELAGLPSWKDAMAELASRH